MLVYGLALSIAFIGGEMMRGGWASAVRLIGVELASANVVLAAVR